MNAVRGTVNSKSELGLRIRVRGPSGCEMEFDAIVDTGFTGDLLLPIAIVQMLELLPRGSIDAALADGTRIRSQAFGADVDWGGIYRRAVVSAIGNSPMIGLNLVHGHRLEADIVAGGEVVVRPIPLN